jgi:flagellar basal body-associated protein FliL
MADDKTKGGEKKGTVRTILTVILLLTVEAALIIGAMTFFGADPEVATAQGPDLDPSIAEAEKIVEVLVLDAKLPNAKSGVSYLYSTEIYAQVKQRNAQLVDDTVHQFYNEIKSEISAVWRTAEPHHFQEPKLENLTRKISAMLSERFGIDAETGEPLLEKCIIVMGTGFRVDR